MIERLFSWLLPTWDDTFEGLVILGLAAAVMILADVWVRSRESDLVHERLSDMRDAAGHYEARASERRRAGPPARHALQAAGDREARTQDRSAQGHVCDKLQEAPGKSKASQCVDEIRRRL
jgi:hypothetical protein